MRRRSGYRGKPMLGTYVTGVEYNFVYSAARLYMDRDCCCDMRRNAEREMTCMPSAGARPATLSADNT